MPPRGPYAKGKARRAEILTAAVDVIARQGYSKATVKELADAVGISQNGLLHYFGSKDALFAEILRHRDETTAAETFADPERFTDDLTEIIFKAVEVDSTSPGLAQLTLRMTGDATEAGHLAHELIKHRYEGIRAFVESVVATKKERGQLAAEVDPSAVAALIYASLDGLRIQWMFDHSIDIRGHMEYLLKNLGLTQSPAAE